MHTQRATVEIIGDQRKISENQFTETVNNL